MYALSYGELMKGNEAFSVDETLELPRMTLTLDVQDQSVYRIAVNYAFPDEDRVLDGAFYAAAACVSGMESGILMALTPYLLPQLFPDESRDPEVSALLQRLVDRAYGGKQE